MSDVKNENQDQHEPETDSPDQEAAGESAPEPSPEERIAALEAEVAQLKDQLLRALAETENVRRRAAREREDASKFAVAAFARDMLTVADNLRRALESVTPEAVAKDETLKALVTGVELTERQLSATFEKHGITRIDALDEKFDSNLHEALFEVPGTGRPAGTVVQVMHPGYLLNGRLLRPAAVGVAKGETKEGEQAQAPADTGPGGRVDTVA